MKWLCCNGKHHPQYSQFCVSPAVKDDKRRFVLADPTLDNQAYAAVDVLLGRVRCSYSGQVVPLGSDVPTAVGIKFGFVVRRSSQSYLLCNVMQNLPVVIRLIGQCKGFVSFSQSLSDVTARVQNIVPNWPIHCLWQTCVYVAYAVYNALQLLPCFEPNFCLGCHSFT